MCEAANLCVNLVVLLRNLQDSDSLRNLKSQVACQKLLTTFDQYPFLHLTGTAQSTNNW